MFNIGLSPLDPVGTIIIIYIYIYIYYFILFFFTSPFSYPIFEPCRSSFIADMDTGVARRLAQGLKTHKRKGTMILGSAKRARIKETSSAVPAQVAVAIDTPSDIEPEVPRASSQSPPTEAPAPEACLEGAPGAERRRRKKTLARKSRSCKVAIEGADCSEEDLGENSFNNRDLIKRLIEGCILSEVIHRIIFADPEQRVWDSLGSFLEVGQFIFSSSCFFT